MPARNLLVVSLNSLFFLPALLGQSSSPSASSPPASSLPAEESNRAVIHTTTREVLLDLVVRDRHHHAVTDLRPEEVEVYEDGVRQNIRVFRNIQGSEQLQTERSVAGASTPATAAKSEDPH